MKSIQAFLHAIRWVVYAAAAVSIVGLGYYGLNLAMTHSESAAYAVLHAGAPFMLMAIAVTILFAVRRQFEPAIAVGAVFYFTQRGAESTLLFERGIFDSNMMGGTVSAAYLPLVGLAICAVLLALMLADPKRRSLGKQSVATAKA